MKNLLPFPKRTGAPESSDEMRSALAVLREVVGQLSERVEVLEARVALGASLKG